MNPEEQQLRLLIREGVRIVKKKQKNRLIEEQRLRSIVRTLIPEVARKTAVADKVIHKNTGVNKLDALLKRIITQIEDAYTNLSSSDVERKSFRYHFLVNFKNILSPIDANRDAPTGEQIALAEQDFSVAVEQDDVDSAPDPDKFLPSRPQDIEAAKAEEEKEEETFEKVDSNDPYVRQGAEAAEVALNDVENQIVATYEGLIAPKDAAAFKDWGLTNLKLYFDMFEDEMRNDLGEEPESPDYPQDGNETLKEVIYEL